MGAVDVSRRGRGHSWEMYLLGEPVGDGRTRLGRAHGERRGKSSFWEMHQVGSPLGDGRR